MTKTELEAHRLALRADVQTEFIRGGFKAIYIVGVAAFIWLAVGELAGRNTTADIIFKAGVEIGKNYVPWVLAALALIYGIRERILRRRVTLRMSERLTVLETLADPARTSSRITADGQTPKQKTP